MLLWFVESAFALPVFVFLALLIFVRVVYAAIGVNSFWLWGSLSALACVFLILACPSIIKKH
jgi:hypothetical protein